MQSSIYLIIAFVAIAAAKELKTGPHVFSDAQSSSSSSQNLDKRYVTQEYTLYLTPEEIKALQKIKSSDTESTQYQKESLVQQQNVEDEQQLKWYNSQFVPEVPQLEIRGIAGQNAYLQEQKSNSEIQQGNYKYVNLYSEETPVEQTKEVPDLSFENLEDYYNWQKEQEIKESKAISQEQSKLENDAKWNQYIAELTKKQEDIKLNEQLKQQWNRILEHNRAQLKSYSSVGKDSKAQKQSKTSVGQWSSKSEIEKEIENILRDQKGYELAKQNGADQAERINQKLPILIHKEVSVTKHVPVPIVKKEKVAVPTPVLIPVPEPYEVKIPHPYPVPQQVFKHIPFPVVRKY